MKRMLWWLIAGSRGGKTRARIIKTLRDRPLNANQLSEKLGYDYKTVRHHIDVLLDNKIITMEGDRYGAVYFLSEELEDNYNLFLEILSNTEGD